MKKIYLIGSGMGDPVLLTEQARLAIGNCDVIFAFERISELFSKLHDDIKVSNYSELIKNVEESEFEEIGILVSGDTGFFSMAKKINGLLGKNSFIEFIPGINSFQYLCSKLKISYEEMNLVSLHGRDTSLNGSIAYNRYTFSITGSTHNASDILNELDEQGLGSVKITAGEFLSMENESILSGTVNSLKNYKFDSLTVLLFENEEPVKKGKVLFDEDFIRSNVPMTKQEVRWTSVNYLNISPKDVIWDIGAGTGSVSIEMSRKAYNGLVYSVEKKEEAFELINKNREKLKAYNLIPVLGDAALAIKELPTPDKVFIGGSGNEMQEILKYLFNVNPAVKIVINAITIETLSEAVSILKNNKCDYRISCLNVAGNKQLGDYNLMMANNPVYVILAVCTGKYEQPAIKCDIRR